MKFSILIANFNNGAFFKDCYRSIIDQTYNNWEVIIIDDCSTDNSVEKIKHLIGNDPRFQFYTNKKNQGCGYTKNRCVDLANGIICGFLDSDDALKKDSLKLMVETHQKSPKIAIVTSKYIIANKDMEIVGECSHGNEIPSGMSYLTYGKGAMTHFASFKKAAYNKTIGINKNYKRAVDQDLYYKMEEQGNHVFINQYLYIYRNHSHNISLGQNKYKAHYWHFRAILDAYKRRKKLNSDIDNFTSKAIKKYKSDYYLNRFETFKNSKNYCSKFYFLYQSFIAAPFYRPFSILKGLVYITLRKI
ncbi:glycosyltransferase family 2 protein [Christiangramia sediminis]|uniref:Glycosyltransferase family 2 protein n=1 Tax=Christiangramia sediminis TaxID=2881336 RepID=A0A9X1RX84_9FLAO|nr:glycosyltransferase family 2 protein [Christiangramia sediminis]MCB7481326.1 glycosyltransferase family 2 protein [Christiangramia sediminis]